MVVLFWCQEWECVLVIISKGFLVEILPFDCPFREGPSPTLSSGMVGLLLQLTGCHLNINFLIKFKPPLV
jgi:hypothetical protein